MVLSTADDWLLANINMTGFYRVNYDSDNWERLLNKLNTQHEVWDLQMEMILRDKGWLISSCPTGEGFADFNKSKEKYHKNANL